MSILEGPKNTGAAVGEAVGAVAGNAIPIPYVGSFIGSTIGKLIGGLFGGGGVQRQILGFNFAAENGVFNSSGFSTKNANVSDAANFGNAIKDNLNSLVDYYDLKIDDAAVRGTIETNIGEKDTGTFFFQSGTQNKLKVSDKPYDAEAVVKFVLGKNNYTYDDLFAKDKEKNETVTQNATAISPMADNSMVFTQESDDAAARLTASYQSPPFVLIGAVLIGIILIMKGK